MNIHIITSSYPQNADDPSGTAGLFVRQFAIELAGAGHRVIVQPVARKPTYEADPGIAIVATPWKGGDRELASISMLAPWNWFIFLHFFLHGIVNTARINKDHAIDRTLCMWAVPSGVFGLFANLRTHARYDVWVLGSDIWRIRKIPILGSMILKAIMRRAERVFADGIRLCGDVTEITGVPCGFLPSSRILPPPKKNVFPPDQGALTHVLFVGRYHPNKGPDLLVQAVACLSEEMRRSLRVHMFGLGPLVNELKTTIARERLEGCIELRGPIQAQDFSDYLKSVSFLVIPSRIESIPVVFSDSLQSGTPVVSMPVGDLGALVAEYRCGIVAESISAGALASALERAIQCGKDFFRNGVDEACKQFDIRKAARIWLGSIIP